MKYTLCFLPGIFKEIVLSINTVHLSAILRKSYIYQCFLNICKFLKFIYPLLGTCSSFDLDSIFKMMIIEEKQQQHIDHDKTARGHRLVTVCTGYKSGADPGFQVGGAPSGSASANADSRLYVNGFR